MSSQDRRAPRIEVALDVFLQTVDGDVPCKTRDASYEGVFIVRQTPLPLRKLIRFRTRLPDSGEELQMLGLVAHTVNQTDASETNRDPGMGIQLFSLGSATRDRWREFIDERYQENPEARATIEESRRPNIRVRIPNPAVLDRFRTVDLPRGSLFVRTPELHPEDTEVDCVITHPLTGDEFILAAQVIESVEGTVKDRGLRLSLELPDDLESLETFLDGEIPLHTTDDAQSAATPPNGESPSDTDDPELPPEGEPSAEDPGAQDTAKAEDTEEQSPDHDEDSDDRT